MILGVKFTKNLRGFTLIELMVALFIMAVMTGMLIQNYPDSSLRITLLNNTHKLALLIREAQIRGSAVDSADSTLGGYGIYISSTTPSQVILFGDSASSTVILSSGNGVYEDGSIEGTTKDIVKTTIDMTNRFSFGKLCVASTTSSTGFACNEKNIPNIDSLTISFSRPKTDANIYINNSTTTGPVGGYSSACIQLYSPKTPASGHVRSVKVYHTGIITTTMEACE